MTTFCSQRELSIYGRSTSVCELFIVPNKNQPRSQRAKDKGNKQRSIQSVVKSYLNSTLEKKWISPTTGGAGISSTASSFDLTTMAQGTTANTRVGATITIKRIILKEVVQTGDATNIVRSTLIHWKPDNGVDVPQMVELYNDSTYPYNSPFLPIKPSNFRVLSDVQFNVDTYNPQKIKEREIILDHKVSFGLGVNTGKDHLYLLVVSDSGAVPNPVYTLNAVVEFTD